MTSPPPMMLPMVTGIRFCRYPARVMAWVVWEEIRAMTKRAILAMLCSKPAVQKQYTHQIRISILAGSEDSFPVLQVARQTIMLHRMPRHRAGKTGRSPDEEKESI